MFSKSINYVSRSLTDDSKSIIDDSRSIIDDSASITDDSSVTLQLVASFIIVSYDTYIFIVQPLI